MDRYTFGKFLATAFFNFDQNLVKNCRLRRCSAGCRCRGFRGRGCSFWFCRKDRVQALIAENFINLIL